MGPCRPGTIHVLVHTQGHGTTAYSGGLTVWFKSGTGPPSRIIGRGLVGAWKLQPDGLQKGQILAAASIASQQVRHQSRLERTPRCPVSDVERRPSQRNRPSFHSATPYPAITRRSRVGGWVLCCSGSGPGGASVDFPALAGSPQGCRRRGGGASVAVPLAAHSRGHGDGGGGRDI